MNCHKGHVYACLFIYKWGHIVSADPACSSFATKNKGVNQKKEDVAQASPSVQESCTPGGAYIWTATPETSPENEPPQEKRAKREAGEEEPEDGEIVDSSDEEEEDKGNTEENTSCVKSCDGAKSPANDMGVIKDEPADS